MNFKVRKSISWKTVKVENSIFLCIARAVARKKLRLRQWLLLNFLSRYLVVFFLRPSKKKQHKRKKMTEASSLVCLMLATVLLQFDSVI